MGNVNTDLNTIEKRNLTQSADTIQDILNQFNSKKQLKSEGIANDAIQSKHIAKGTVGNNELAANSVGTDEIRNGVVTKEKLSGMLRSNIELSELSICSLPVTTSNTNTLTVDSNKYDQSRCYLYLPISSNPKFLRDGQNTYTLYDYDTNNYIVSVAGLQPQYLYLISPVESDISYGNEEHLTGIRCMRIALCTDIKNTWSGTSSNTVSSKEIDNIEGGICYVTDATNANSQLPCTSGGILMARTAPSSGSASLRRQQVFIPDIISDASKGAAIYIRDQLEGSSGTWDSWGEWHCISEKNTQYASTEQAGVIKLYSRSGVNASGLIVSEDGTTVVNVDNNHGLYRSGAGQITTAEASEAEIDAGENQYNVVTPRRLKYAMENIPAATPEADGLMSAADKEKLDNLSSSGTGTTTVDSSLNIASENPVQNKVITPLLAKFAEICRDSFFALKDDTWLSGNYTLSTLYTVNAGDIWYIPPHGEDPESDCYDNIKDADGKIYTPHLIDGTPYSPFPGEAVVIYFPVVDETGGDCYILWKGKK